MIVMMKMATKSSRRRPLVPWPHVWDWHGSPLKLCHGFFVTSDDMFRLLPWGCRLTTFTSSSHRESWSHLAPPPATLATSLWQWEVHIAICFLHWTLWSQSVSHSVFVVLWSNVFISLVCAALSDGVMLDALFLPAAPGNLHWMPLPLSHDNSWESILSHGGFSPHAPPPSPGKYEGHFYLERISVSKHIFHKSIQTKMVIFEQIWPCFQLLNLV